MSAVFFAPISSALWPFVARLTSAVPHGPRARTLQSSIFFSRVATTQLLVEDIERLRALFGVERWLVFGGSWGSTLALAYGQAHPERCLGFILRGIFLCTAAEIDWFLNGVQWFYPELYDEFVAPLAPEERADLLGAYSRRLLSDVYSWNEAMLGKAGVSSMLARLRLGDRPRAGARGASTIACSCGGGSWYRACACGNEGQEWAHGHLDRSRNCMVRIASLKISRPVIPY